MSEDRGVIAASTVCAKCCSVEASEISCALRELQDGTHPGVGFGASFAILLSRITQFLRLSESNPSSAWATNLYAISATSG